MFKRLNVFIIYCLILLCTLKLNVILDRLLKRITFKRLNLSTNPTKSTNSTNLGTLVLKGIEFG